MYLITNKAEDVLKGAFHISVASMSATICNVNALEICPFTLWHEGTQGFRTGWRRSQECSLAQVGGTMWVPTGTTMVCTAGKMCMRGRLKALSHPSLLPPAVGQVKKYSGLINIWIHFLRKASMKEGVGKKVRTHVCPVPSSSNVNFATCTSFPSECKSYLQRETLDLSNQTKKVIIQILQKLII